MAQSTGSLKLTVTDNGGVTDTLRFGELVGATDGLDANLGEFELPPVAPSGAFDIRWIVSGYEGFAVDYRDTVNAQNKKNIWTLQFQPGSSGYPMTITWDTTKLWSGFFHMYDAVTMGGKLSIDMSSVGNIKINDNTIKSLIIVHTFTVTRNIVLKPGWNMVSIPVGLKNWDITRSFSSYISCYSYHGGYQSVSTLEHGKGYWINYPDSSVVFLVGEPFAADTFTVASGWNLIGSTYSTTSTSSIQQIPGSIISSYFFSYSNGYKIATSIIPGQGIWVKATQPGKLFLSSASMSKTSQQDRALELKNWNTITFTDANGGSGMLLFSSQQNDIIQYDMPPRPPENMFDVRYSNDKFSGNLVNSNSTLSIHVQGVKGFVEIKWSVKDGRKYVLTGISKDSILIEGEGTYIIGSSSVAARLGLALYNGQTIVPDEFELSQNYPNPFNPTTTIEFVIPHESQVKILIYDLLGREVIRLVDELKPRGKYNVRFNASNLPGGVYFYKMIAANFSRTKKLIIVK
ncbi:MAG: T9SS type A sorting domain-containing protein [Candidatus Kryptoniota bacterium]